MYGEGARPIEYLDDPRKTWRLYDRQRRTVGDVGYLDADDYLYLTDRKHNMIISGGVNIYPQEAKTCCRAIPPSPTWRWSACPTTSSARP